MQMRPTANLSSPCPPGVPRESFTGTHIRQFLLVSLKIKNHHLSKAKQRKKKEILHTNQT